MATLSRPVAGLIWSVGVPLVHGVIPVELSRLSAHYGWTDGHPTAWNLALGAGPVIAGAMCLAWAVVLHIVTAPRSGPVAALHVIDRGVYAFSRNPMYIGELVLWLGWALLLGSWPVALGLFALWFVIAIWIVPWEEQSLASTFGAAYTSYRDRTPRWLVSAASARRTPPTRRATNPPAMARRA